MSEPISLRSTAYTGEPSREGRALAIGVPARRGPGLHIILFAATFATTATASALHQGIDIFTAPSRLVAGFPYAIAIMTILLSHECGHYVLARFHRVDATLPFFIPAPPVPFFIGTLGAFIRMRSLPHTRRALFDVGAAGPWAGILVAIPVLLVGLALSEVHASGPSPDGGLFLGDALLFRFLCWLVLGTTGDDVTIVLHPVALAGWVGLLVTALNLIPVGQLDGGHVVYAALGERWHRWISRGTLATLLVLGLGGAGTWLVWAVLLTALGVRHPRLLDVETPLDRPRRWGALATIGLFLLTFMPQPLYFAEPAPRIERAVDAIPIGAPAPPRGEAIPL